MQDEDNNAQSNCPENTTDEKNQLCFDVTKGAYDFTITDINGLDAKAGNLIYFVGAILGVYAAFGPNFINSINKAYYNFHYMSISVALFCYYLQFYLQYIHTGGIT